MLETADVPGVTVMDTLYHYLLLTVQDQLYRRQILTALTILFITIIYVWRKTHSNLPPGPWGHPVIGNLNLFWWKPHIRLTNLKDQYGDIFSLSLGGHPAVVVSSLEAIHEALVRQGQCCSGRSQVTASTRQLYTGDQDGGLSWSDLCMKSKVKKDFILYSMDAVCSGSDGLEDVICSEALSLVDWLLQSNAPQDVAPVIESLSLRVTLYLINGKLYETDDENFLQIWQTYRLRAEACEEKWYDFVPFLKRFERDKSVADLEQSKMQLQYQRQIINRHKDCYNPSIVHDLVDQMLIFLENEEDQGLLDQDDLDQLFVELSGSGFLAVCQLLRWLLLYVTVFPDVQTKVQAELASVVGNERCPKLSDQPYLPYTCAVIMETHRLASVLPLLYPHRVTDHIQFMGYDIPKDTLLYLNVWSLHHDHRYWKHPMKFDPTRFLETDGSLHIPDHFLPFGDGVRACPGESLADIEIFLVFTHMLHQLTLTLDGGQPVSLDGICMGPILAPHPFKLSAIPRGVQAELASVVGNERCPRLSDQPYLPYTCAVIMEMHRLASVLPLLYPHRMTDHVQFMGYNIPKDTLLYINVWSLHHDHRYWKHPMKFDPTRFLETDGSLHIPDHFLPFGDGVRACPGESLADIEIFLVFTHILHQLTLTLDGAQPVSLDGICMGPILAPHPFKLSAVPRTVNSNDMQLKCNSDYREQASDC